MSSIGLAQGLVGSLTAVDVGRPAETVPCGLHHVCLAEGGLQLNTGAGEHMPTSASRRGKHR